MSLDVSKVCKVYHIDNKDIDYIILQKGNISYKFVMHGIFEEVLPLDFSKYDDYYIHLKSGWVIFKKDLIRKQKELEKQYGVHRQVSE